MQYRNLVLPLVSMLLLGSVAFVWSASRGIEERIKLDVQLPQDVFAEDEHELMVGIDNQLSQDIEVVGISLC